MQSAYADKLVKTNRPNDLQMQLEECQALIRLQHEYITHLEKGLDVMKGMAAYIEILESRLEELGQVVAGFQCNSISEE